MFEPNLRNITNAKFNSKNAFHTAVLSTQADQMFLANFCGVAATALLYYDLSLTLSSEIRCIWRRKPTGATVLFFVNRYGTLVNRTLMLINLFSLQEHTRQTADTMYATPPSKAVGSWH
ncbi:hypothetical protein C8Q75DRAFT_808694 [Abortiporus biennis]|nr:hypothetical protein C8Q75DRAFT_808694 [Abortiporus biennis]